MPGDGLLAVKPVTGKTDQDIQIEWNQIAVLRHWQIASGLDLSFSYVLLPLIRKLMGKCRLENVLDIGCGTGELTKEIASLSAQVIAVDSSSESVAIARKTCAKSLNVSFDVGTAEEFAYRRSDCRFTTAISNMTLMDCLNLDSVIRKLMGKCRLENVLDIGCGTGELTKEIASLSAQVIAVDSSSESVAIARKTCAKSLNVSFDVGTAEEFAYRRSDCRFTTAISNMTLMDCLNLDSVLSAVASLLDANGSFIATITHPWFWPQYWGYADAPWFNYQNETILETTFRISGDATDCVTTHVHRPLSHYLKSLSQAGFRVDQILEPFPSEKVHNLYPERWKFPRFLVFVASKAAGTGCFDAQGTQLAGPLAGRLRNA